MYLIRKCLQELRKDPWILMEAGLALIFFRVSLKFIPFNKFYLVLKIFLKTPRRPYTDRLNYTYRVVKSVNRCGHYLVRGKCLPQALAVHVLLNNKRIFNDLHVGFNKTANVYSAHAWIEAENKILIGEVKNIHSYFSIFPVIKSQI